MLMDVQRHMNQCQSSRDAEHLVSTLDKFIESGRPPQESRLQRMSELVIELYGKSIVRKLDMYSTKEDLHVCVDFVLWMKNSSIKLKLKINSILQFLRVVLHLKITSFIFHR